MNWQEVDDFTLEAAFWGINPDAITDEDMAIMDEMERRKGQVTS